MANSEHVEILQGGVIAWNTWRGENPNTIPDLTGANLSMARLTGADLTKANLTEADLTGANLTGADLTGANLTEADPHRGDP